MDRKPADREAEELAEGLVPGWKVTRPGTAQLEGDSIARLAELGIEVATMPSIETLKARHAGRASADRESSARDDDTKIVSLRNGYSTKAAGISRSEGRILWTQG